MSKIRIGGRKSLDAHGAIIYRYRSSDTYTILNIGRCGKEGFRELFCENHKIPSPPVPYRIASSVRESTKWCKECRRLIRCLRDTCKKKLWLCYSCQVHRCEHLCFVKGQYTVICNGCRFVTTNDPDVEIVEFEMTEEDKILIEVKKLQPVLAPDREREWPWIIKRMSGETTKVLDAACGGGFLQKYLLNSGFDVTATDFNPDAKLYAADGPEREKFVLQDLRKPLPVEWSEVFDYVLLISTVEHLENDDDTLVVKNLSKCVKLNGSMFISFPYGNETEWRKIGNNTERFYSENGMYERLLIPAKLQVKDREVFTKEELDWPWKDIMVLEVCR